MGPLGEDPRPLTTLAPAGSSSGTSTTMTLSCGDRQFGKSPEGEHGDTYTYSCSPSLPGTSVLVCGPQSVRTADTYWGLALSEMSKIRMPSNPSGSVVGTEGAPHSVPARG